MKIFLIILCISLAATATYAGNMLLFVGSSGGTPAVLTNLRITDVPDFRITNTGDNRAVSP